MTRRYRPAGDKILVIPHQLEVKTKSGIILKAEEDRYRDMMTVKVLELGPLAFKSYGDGDPWCKPGDLVMVPKNAGGVPFFDPETSQELLILYDSDVIALVEGA